MNERTLANLWYAVVAISAAVTLPIALFLVMRFDVTDSRWWVWLWRYWQSQEEVPPRFMWTGLAWLLSIAVLAALCPFSRAPTHYGRARWATGRLVLWRLGLTAKHGVVVGRVGGRVLMYDAPLSTLLLAPAGTGKTRGTIIPTMLAYRGSVIVHDPKGEAYQHTAGYRALLGPVFLIEWSASDQSRCWNPLSPGNLPKSRGGRGNAVDRLCAVAIPGDPSSFWIAAPRLALAAITLFLIYDAERQRCGKEATFSAVLSWLAAAEVEDAEDSVALHFERAAGIAEIENYPERVAIGLRLFAQMNYKTRADVLGTINSALAIFLNEEVATVTSRSDFTLSDLRGRANRPASLYIIVPQNDRQAFAKVTGMLIEMASMELLSKQPTTAQSSVLFVLDEAAFLPPLDAISNGPAIGRGYRVHYLICAQDYGQLRKVYGRNEVDNIVTNTAYKIVLAQNHVETAEFISRTIGNTTRRRRSLGRQFALVRPGELRSSVSESYETAPLVSAQDILSLRFGRQLVMVQNHLHMPVMARSPFFDKVRAFRRRSRQAAPFAVCQSGK